MQETSSLLSAKINLSLPLVPEKSVQLIGLISPNYIRYNWFFCEKAKQLSHNDHATNNIN